MNRSKLLAIIQKDADHREFIYNLCGNYQEIYDDDPIVKDLASLGYSVKSEEGYGGEGCGEQYWGVFSTTKDGTTQYWRFSGYYASYNGAEVELDSLEEVKPKEVKVIEWVKK